MTPTAALDTFLAEASESLECRLEELIAEDASAPDLFAAARYSLFSGGKRLRPLLTLATCHSLKGSWQAAVDPACALEILHTYSLIHDDLPCMDDDDLRRGKPTLHRVVSEGLAVLTGDYLLTRAFEVLATTSALSERQRLRLVSTVARAAGGQGMVGGQAIELLQEGEECPLATVEQIHRMKTGALIGAAIECGAIAGEATSAQMESLRQFGQAVGLAFQIVDDILDAGEGDLSSYVELVGLEAAQVKSQQLLQSALKCLHGLPGDSLPLAHLAQIMVNRKQ